MPRHRSQKKEELSPLLLRLIKAANCSGKDDRDADLAGVPDALREFGSLALWALPTYGVFLPNNDDVSQVVARVAKERLGMEEARGELRRALSVLPRFDERDPIESALNHVLSVSDEAYFYAGLALGVTMADLTARR